MGAVVSRVFGGNKKDDTKPQTQHTKPRKRWSFRTTRRHEEATLSVASRSSTLPARSRLPPHEDEHSIHSEENNPQIARTSSLNELDYETKSDINQQEASPKVTKEQHLEGEAENKIIVEQHTDEVSGSGGVVVGIEGVTESTSPVVNQISVEESIVRTTEDDKMEDAHELLTEEIGQFVHVKQLSPMKEQQGDMEETEQGEMELYTHGEKEVPIRSAEMEEAHTILPEHKEGNEIKDSSSRLEPDQEEVEVAVKLEEEKQHVECYEHEIKEEETDVLVDTALSTPHYESDQLSQEDHSTTINQVQDSVVPVEFVESVKEHEKTGGQDEHTEIHEEVTVESIEHEHASPVHDEQEVDLVGDSNEEGKHDDIVCDKHELREEEADMLVSAALSPHFESDHTTVATDEAHEIGVHEEFIESVKEHEQHAEHDGQDEAAGIHEEVTVESTEHAHATPVYDEPKVSAEQASNEEGKHDDREYDVHELEKEGVDVLLSAALSPPHFGSDQVLQEDHTEGTHEVQDTVIHEEFVESIEGHEKHGEHENQGETAGVHEEIAVESIEHAHASPVHDELEIEAERGFPEQHQHCGINDGDFNLRVEADSLVHDDLQTHEVCISDEARVASDLVDDVLRSAGVTYGDVPEDDISEMLPEPEFSVNHSASKDDVLIDIEDGASAAKVDADIHSEGWAQATVSFDNSVTDLISSVLEAAKCEVHTDGEASGDQHNDVCPNGIAYPAMDSGDETIEYKCTKQINVQDISHHSPEEHLINDHPNHEDNINNDLVNDELIQDYMNSAHTLHSPDDILPNNTISSMSVTGGSSP